MSKTTLLALIVALSTGVIIGVHATLTTKISQGIGPIRTGLLLNFIGGSVGGLILLVLTLQRPDLSFKDINPVLFLSLVAGIGGISILMGIAFATTRIGIAAGLGAILLSQMAAAMVVDTFGFGLVEPISFDLTRLVGIVVLMVGVWLILPKG